MLVPWLIGCQRGPWPGEPLTEWQYAWAPDEASPRSPAQPPAALAWRDLAVADAPELARDHRVVWMRARVPRGTWHEPVVFAPKAYLSLAAYLDGERAYHLDDYRAASGIPWYAIALPPDRPAPDTIVFRLYSRYPRIGFAETPRLGEHAQFVAALYARDLTRLLLASFFFAVAIAAAVLALRSREAKALLGLSLYTSGLVMWSLFHCKTKQLWLPDTARWFELWWVAIPAIGAGVSLFIEEVFGPGPRRFLRHLRRAFFALTAIAVVSLVSDDVLEVLSPFVFLAPRALAVIGFVAAGAYLTRLALRGNASARIFTLGFAAASVAAVHDFGLSFGAWPGAEPWAQWGYAALVLSLLGILRQRWLELHQQVHRHATSLVRHVRERDELLRDLHDGIGGIITNVGLLAERERAKTSDANASGVLETIAGLASDGVSEIRTLILGLENCPDSWRAVAAELRRAGSLLLEPHDVAHAFELDVDPRAPAPTPRMVVHVTRIHREALVNVLKHAGATRVEVSLEVSPHRLALAIADDGDGDARGGGGSPRVGVGARAGLRSMFGRAAELGGTLTLDQTAGTRLRLDVPLEAAAPADAAPSPREP